MHNYTPFELTDTTKSLQHTKEKCISHRAMYLFTVSSQTHHSLYKLYNTCNVVHHPCQWYEMQGFTDFSHERRDCFLHDIHLKYIPAIYFHDQYCQHMNIVKPVIFACLLSYEFRVCKYMR